MRRQTVRPIREHQFDPRIRVEHASRVERTYSHRQRDASIPRCIPIDEYRNVSELLRSLSAHTSTHRRNCEVLRALSTADQRRSSDGDLLLQQKNQTR